MLFSVFNNMLYSFKKPLIFLAIVLSCPLIVFSQGKPEIGIFGGISAYNGDLEPRRFAFDQMHPAFGIFIQKSVYKDFGLRLGATFGKISGADSASSKASFRSRNLSFESKVADFHLLLKYDFSKIKEATGILPYVFAGVSLFHFDPYARDSSNTKIYLAPLSTEGEGLPEYPDRRPYKLTQFSIPFGAGARYALTDGIYLGLEFQLNMTFTDYLDDVSKNYVDQATLVSHRGPSAAYFAYRGNELPGHNADPYPAEGTMRGSPKANDWYYFAGLTLTFRLNGGNGGLFGNGLRHLRCPPQAK